MSRLLFNCWFAIATAVRSVDFLLNLQLCEKVDYSGNMLLHLLAKSLAGKHAGESQISKWVHEQTVVIIRLRCCLF
jgi:hypothetical protein